ncbi:sortase B protein-sorting domain-containing protein [Psychrobacter faecalis]|uniref:sortase B protein-sorting domain-containing protein n=1 Tax=Psychrobacter faecalis TaxID=180588 RepID=UPI003FD16483
MFYYESFSDSSKIFWYISVSLLMTASSLKLVRQYSRISLAEYLSLFSYNSIIPCAKHSTEFLSTR